MAPKKKSNKKKEDLEETTPVVLEEPLPEPVPVPLEEPVAVVEEPVPVVEEPTSVVVEEPVVVVEEPVSVVVEEPEKINLEINEILNPLLSNDLENLLLQSIERPKSPPPRRINRRGATMGMKLGV